MKESNFEVGMVNCFFCGKPKEIIMNTQLTKKYADEIKKIDGCAIDFEPCDECKKYIGDGVMLIQVRDGESGDNPYRTGVTAVIKKEIIQKAIKKEMAEIIISRGFAFIEETIWNTLFRKEEEDA